MVFNRIWRNQEEKLYGASGNEFRRTQTEEPAWQEIPFISSVGYGAQRLQLYLTAGEHTLTLEATGEPLALSALTFRQLPETGSYADYLAAGQAAGGKIIAADTAPLVIQGEDADRKSTSTLYAVEDRTSSAHPAF